MDSLCLSGGAAAVLHACMVSADLLREGESPGLASAAILSKRLTAAGTHTHTCGHFSKLVALEGSLRTILKDVDGPFYLFTRDLHLLPQTLPRKLRFGNAL